MAQYTINGKRIDIKRIKFSGKQSRTEYATQCYTALAKIGVTKEFINIDYGGFGDESFALVEWSINGKTYCFRSDLQDNMTANMGAVAQAIQDDVRQITRGIKELYQVLRQYDALPSPETVTPSKNPFVDMSLAEIKKLMIVNDPSKPDGNKTRFSLLQEAFDIKKNKGESNG